MNTQQIEEIKQYELEQYEAMLDLQEQQRNLQEIVIQDVLRGL